ncbi:MAG: 3-deoxy-manno-octulosonate cytidylyltransferase [Vicinamibacterales bacterium]
MTETSVLAVIPARYHSTRLPGKVLLDIAGRPMIEHVFRRVAAAKTIDAVIVATDDQRVADVVESFGGVACLTSSDHVSGTDRIAEVVSQVSCELVVGVQADEPLLDPAIVDATVAPLRADRRLSISTAARAIADPSELANPHVVKVVRDSEGFALYFSRAPIPHGRDRPALTESRVHIGMYVYRRDVLLRLAALRPGVLELAEVLEQLRALENGIRIKVVDTSYELFGVDTPEDLERVRQRMLTGVHQ